MKRTTKSLSEAKPEVSVSFDQDTLREVVDRMTEALPAAEVVPLKEVSKSRTPPHISVYISFDAIVEFKRLALDLGHLSPHDLYREGLDMVLAKHGRPSLAEIEGK